MMTISPFVGSRANWTFDPPVSTPTRRMQANAASRMAWYSTSVRVCAGATVIESPVWTPIGSRFSIEQMTTQLSARSRMTSSSYSFHPAIDRSMRISEMGLAARPVAATRSNSAARGGDAGALPAQDERRTDHDGQPDALDRGQRVVHRVGGGRRRHVQPDALHRHLEALAVLGRGDGLGVGADELGGAGHAHGLAVDQLHRQVERGLPAERGQHGVGALALDDLRQVVGVERLDVGGVGEVGVGHDRRRVRVGEDHAVALGPQHLAGLRARVVELAGLADDDGSGADEEDRLDVGPAGHLARPPAGGVDEVGELVEQVGRVVGARPRLGVVLHAERPQGLGPDALDHAVVQVDVGDGRRRAPARPRRRRSCGSGW